MNTESTGSLTDISTALIDKKNNQKAKQVERLHPKITQNWNLRDALYLLVLIGLVVAMALRYTPNLTGEVAGVWWDPLLNMWTLSWDTTTLLHAPAHLWQAPILYPNSLSLSYSENLLGEVIFFAPFYLITHNPVLAYNITFYLTFLLCGINMYIMARYYTGKSFAAFVAALIYAFAPYRLGQIDHIHVVAGEWMPLAFLYLDFSLQQGRWRHWILFALFYCLQILSSIYYGIFLSYALLTFVLIRYVRPFVAQFRSRKGAYLKDVVIRGAKPVIVLAVMGLFLTILMAPYLVSLRNGFSRSLVQTVRYEATISDFVFAVPFNWFYGVNFYNGIALPYDSEHYLFLGLATMILATVGAILVLRHKQSTMRLYVWTGVLVLLFAFGPFLHFSAGIDSPFGPARFLGITPPASAPDIPMPWIIAYYVLPGFSGLRVPARLIGVLLIMLALLSAHTIAWLQDMTSKKNVAHEEKIPSNGNPAPRRQVPFFTLRKIALQVFLVLIPCAILLESIPAFLPVTSVPTGNAIPPVYQWLATHGAQQPIVELPMASIDRNFVAKDEAWYDYYAIYHSHPFANGWSGYRPSLTVSMASTLLDFPSEASLTLLKKYHIYYVVLHLQFYSPTIAKSILAQAESNPELRRVEVFGNDSVWQVI